MNKTWYVGLIKRDCNTVILQARRNIDFLDCEIWRYDGKIINLTKKELKTPTRKDYELRRINQKYGTNFTKIIID